MRDQKPPRCGLYTGPSGEAEGYVLYRTDLRWEQHLPASTLEIIELIALTAEAYLGLWRYCCEIDLVKEVSADMRCADEPLPWLLDNPRAAVHQALRADLLWLRLLDVPSALAARRYPCEAQLVLDVRDPLGLCTGRFVLHGGPDGATCHASAEPADLSLDTRALGAIFLGGVSLRTLAWGGVIEEHRPGALDTGERLFRWPVTPWCSTTF
jgi:predicted acetyltransferase